MRRRLILLAAATAALAVAGIAYATIPDGNKVVSACMLKNVGTIRLIDSSLPSSNLMSHCSSLETQVSWNQQGQPGAPGPQGAQGPQGPAGPPGPAGQDGAGTETVAFSREADNVKGNSVVLSLPLDPGAYTFTASLSIADNADVGLNGAGAVCVLFDARGGNLIDTGRETIPLVLDNVGGTSSEAASMALTGAATFSEASEVHVTCRQETSNSVTVLRATLVATKVGEVASSG
jgi:hypothetical protein